MVRGEKGQKKLTLRKIKQSKKGGYKHKSERGEYFKFSR
jgi:hypothetical protein